MVLGSSGISLLDNVFKEAQPEIPVEKKSDSSDEDKSVGDSSALHLALADCFMLHPQFSLDTFLGTLLLTPSKLMAS